MSQHTDNAVSGDIRERLLALVRHLEHVLPAQAPIRDFVHHNTLHGFQHLPFPEALASARRLTGARGYLAGEQWRGLYARGRITRADLEAVLDSQEEFGAGIANGLRRRDVVLAALLNPVKRLSRSQLRWQVEEIDALRRMQPGVGSAARDRLLAGGADERAMLHELWVACLDVLDLAHEQMHPEELVDLPPEEIERIAEREKAGAEPDVAGYHTTPYPLRKEAGRLLESLLARLGQDATLRSLLADLTGVDILEELRPALIGHVANFLDQGVAAWRNPGSAGSFYAAWRAAAGHDHGWIFNDMPEWRTQLEGLPGNALDALVQELHQLGLPEERWAGYLERLALEIPGWSGMVLWRDRHPDYAALTAPVAMLDYLAVRLVLERLFARRLVRRNWQIEASIPMLRWYFQRHPAELIVRHALFSGRLPEYLVTLGQRQAAEAADQRNDAAAPGWLKLARLIQAWRDTPAEDRRGDISVSGTAWPLFCLCQHLGINAEGLRRLGYSGASAVLDTAMTLDTDRTGYLWLLAYERHYREEIFAALAANHERGVAPRSPAAQLVFCMDDREEGMRRHIEEINPDIETLGGAAHFGVFQNWRGLDDKGVTPLCPVVPVVVRPAHEVREVARGNAGSSVAIHQRRYAMLETWRDRIHHATRLTLVAAPVLTAVFAPFALVATTARLLAPARFGALLARMRTRFEKRVATELVFSAPADSAPATPETPRAGFTDTESADRLAAYLANLGLTRRFAPIVAIIGHGSNSVNNPHLSAYDCGACAGRHSGPNARLFAAMANRTGVRAILAGRGIVIPETTWFLGAEHNTCDDVITWYDSEDVPAALRDGFDKLRHELARASCNHAHERCRRFASAPVRPTSARAMRHVLGRRHDLSQARPELGHATNACAFIGRRSMSRGAFFDRRSFLISYDPTQDTDGTVLERHLLTNGAVGAGISLEYYFSTANNEQYGCGTKTVHNIAGLFGVMEGAGSDLRTGLPRQMIEIHEAMRLLVVVEHSTDVITRIYQRQPPLQELVGNGWLVVAAKDPDSAAIHLFDPARGWLRWQGGASLSTVANSVDWYSGKQDPLAPVLLTRPLAHAGGGV
jgi:hypothetical protein